MSEENWLSRAIAEAVPYKKILLPAGEFLLTQSMWDQVAEKHLTLVGAGSGTVVHAEEGINLWGAYPQQHTLQDIWLE